MINSTDLAEAICISLLLEPASWSQELHTITHSNGLQIWTANTQWFDLHKYAPGRSIGFGAWGRLKVWWALRRWRKWMRLNAGPPVDPARSDIERLLQPLVGRRRD